MEVHVHLVVGQLQQLQRLADGILRHHRAHEPLHNRHEPTGCCTPLVASAEGRSACTASSTVLRWPALADGSVLGPLPSPRDVLASPLLLPAAAALLDGHHRPRPWPCPSAACPSAAPHTPSTPRTERRGATGTPQPAPRYSLPTRVLETPHRSPCTGASKHRAPCSAPSMPARAPASPPRRTRPSASRKLVWPPRG
jgi:hypothetical protein